MATRWLDFADPTREELVAALPAGVDPDVVEVLTARREDGPEPRPLLEAHGAYAFGVLVALATLPEQKQVVQQEIDLIASPELLLTVRKTPPGGPAYDAAALGPAAESGAPVGLLVHRLADDVAESYLVALDAIYTEIDELEDEVDELRGAEARMRLSNLRHELLHRRRTVSATRAAVRRVLDGRIEVGDHALFPPELERLFADTYDTLVRVTEELDIARDLLASVRDHLQAKIAESQNEVAKKLTVIASLVLVPSLVVGFYGQNFESAFAAGYWSLGVSSALIGASTAIQLALFRWRRWI